MADKSASHAIQPRNLSMAGPVRVMSIAPLNFCMCKAVCAGMARPWQQGRVLVLPRVRVLRTDEMQPGEFRPVRLDRWREGRGIIRA